MLFEVVYIKYSLSMASSAIVENSTNHSSDIVHHARPRFVELLCVCVCVFLELQEYGKLYKPVYFLKYTWLMHCCYLLALISLTSTDEFART